MLVASVAPGGERANARHPSRAPASSDRLVLSVTAAPWRLPVPMSAVATVAQGSGVLIAGGLDATGRSSSGVVRLDVARGRVTPAGGLVEAVHDAAGAMVGGAPVLFGGGSSASSAVVQSMAPSGDPQLLGQLPSKRSDLTAVAVGRRAFLVGGYDGSALSPDVLSTGDGTSFSTVARLPNPVRYPAVAAVGETIYAFGGESAAGGESDVIQAIDTRTGSARAVGHLPTPLAHSAAVRLGGQVYLAGGRSHGAATDSVWSYDPRSGSVSSAGRLPQAVSDAGVATVGDAAYLVGGRGDATPVDSVVVLRPQRVPGPSPGAAAARTPAPAGRPFVGRLLIADRGNNRILLVDAAKRVLWRYPAPGRPAPPGGFYFPDDAFFANHGTAILSNEEDNHTIVQIGFPDGRLQWSYGHARQPGSSSGYLNQPDDAYLLKDRRIAVADAKNCRILVIDRAHGSTSQIGTTGRCVHDPPRSLGYPNGDTPLSDGNLLVSEIFGSYVDELTLDGRLVWSVHLPIAYPSDPQQLGPDLYLVADYHRPGGIYEFTREGRIVWSYHPSSGAAMLDHPSLAERLPNGLIAVNDDYRHRVALIDPASQKIVWQYGHDDVPGTGPNALNTPDGFDLLDPANNTPTHPETG